MIKREQKSLTVELGTITIDLDSRELAEEIAQLVVSQFQASLAGGHAARRLVGRNEMAELAGLSVPAIDRMVSSGSIPSIQQGKRRLFNPEAVLQAMQKASE